LKIEWHEDAVKDLKRLDRPIQRRIRDHLIDLAQQGDARPRAEPYKGPLRGYWKLRVGDFRLICAIESENEPRLFIVLVAHRSEAYTGRSVKAAKRRRDKR
jgi:mRNA interferase RelE/StbE